MEEIVTNPHKHITSELVDYCLKIGGLIDKVFTGNGFTTAYSNILNSSGKPDFLIVPNIQTAIDKKGNSEFNKYGKKVLYLHSESSDKLQSDYSNIGLIVCVADTYYHKELYKIPCRYTLLDEVHTAKIQSDFRPTLFNLFDVLRTKQNVSYVTATPYINDVANVKIINTHHKFTETKNVYVSNSYNRTVQEISKQLEELKTKKGRILIASNEAKKIVQVLKDLNVDEVDLMTGKGFRRSFCKYYSKKKITKDARVTIMSTKAFEGHDVNDENTSVFVFQNYNAQNCQFLDSQIIQALGRVRNKPKYLHINWSGTNGKNYTNFVVDNQNNIEELCNIYCKVFNKQQKKQLEEGDKKDERQSYEGDNFVIKHKGKSIRLGDIRNYIVYDDKEFGVKKVREAKTNYIACDVLKTKLNIFENGLNEKYFNERGYNIINCDKKPFDKKLRNVSHKIKVDNLIHNRDINPKYISKKELIRWSFDIDSKGDFIGVYRKLKDYLQDNMPCRLDYFFKDFTSMDDAINDTLSIVKAHYKKIKKAMPCEESLRSAIFEIILNLIKGNRPTPKIRAFRNYNVFAVTSDYIKDHISNKFDLKVKRFDITACAPTMIQALAGDEKHNVYDVGENRKKSKTKIVSALNSIHNDQGKKAKWSEQLMRDVIQKYFNEKSSQLIKDRYYKSGISNLFFNEMIYHENLFIQQAIRKIDQWSDRKHIVTTKHDEISIYFEGIDDETFERLSYDYGEILSKEQYLGFDNWFGFVPKTETLEIKTLEIENTKTPELYPNSNQYTMTF